MAWPHRHVQGCDGYVSAVCKLMIVRSGAGEIQLLFARGAGITIG